MTQLTDSGALNTTFAYDATNKLTSRTLPNGVVSTHQYDGLDRLTRLTHAKTPNTLADFQYQFNNVNNITQLTDGAGAHNYAYDVIDRLTAATHPNQTNESYSFDDVGNRSASQQGSSYSYHPFNRLITANSSNFAYDTNGNLISKIDASGTWSYIWDYENRLIQASLYGGVTVTYAYDALGRRIQRTSSGSGTTKFVYDGADVVRDLNNDLTIATEYLNGPGIDDKLRQTTGGSTSYFLADHLGSTRGLTDATGNVTSSLTYDSFGNQTSGSSSTRYTYTGRELDEETGLSYYRARWYDPQQGRFVSEDPIGLVGGINLFAYVENNPVRFSDPSGLCPQERRPCDMSRDAVERAARAVATKIDGAKFDIQNGEPILRFPTDYFQTISKLRKSGLYSGILAYNPIDHRGGYEFRTYGSPGFHFKVDYPRIQETHERGRLGVRVLLRPAMATDLHIDCNNPVGSGIAGTFNHGVDFIRHHTPWWLPPLLSSGGLIP